jgi:hypothetical protein
VKRSSWCVLVVAAALAGPRAASAQSVTGAVHDGNTAAPIPGVLVSVIDDAGVRVRAVLSDGAGRFTIELGRFGRFRVRAERIGLGTVTSRTFELFSFAPHFERILMTDRAIEIAGLVVDTRVQACRLDPSEAVRIQRWWRDVRTALDVSSVVQRQGLALAQVERFEREWNEELDEIIRADSRREMILSSRPFVSEDAAFLAQGGYVQGPLQGQRDYFAPDADVLLSDVFLASHCFSIRDHGDDGPLLGLSFEPSVESEVPDITGTLWVDTTSAELRSLDFRYANTDDVPANASGGHLSFRYLPSGAWVVSEWFIRMPNLARRRRRSPVEVVGYTDVGGRITRVETEASAADDGTTFGALRGVVSDSIRGGGLEGAMVVVLGTRYRTSTDASGAFSLEAVPAGRHAVTFFHSDLEAWGLGLPYAEVVVEEDSTSTVALAVPSFRQAARALCLGSGGAAQTVFVGYLAGPDGRSLANTPLQITWRRDVGRAADIVQDVRARTDSDGRFVTCVLPGGAIARVRAQVGERWLEGEEVSVPLERITYVELSVVR